MSEGMAFEDLEMVYELLAASIDKAGPDNESLFLTKLCLTLAHRVGDREVVQAAVALALSDLQS